MSPSRLFLVDGTGALLTALMLGLVLTTFEACFGMPTDVLYVLSAIAFIYSIYSFLCYWRIKKNWRSFLLVVAIANLLYCFLTIGLVVRYRLELTRWGVTYFLLEAAIILSLVVVELRTVANSIRSGSED